MESALMDIFMRYAPDMNCAEGKKSGRTEDCQKICKKGLTLKHLEIVQ